MKNEYIMIINAEMDKDDIKALIYEINSCEFCNKGEFEIIFKNLNYISKKNITNVNIEIKVNKRKNICEELFEMINCEFCHKDLDIYLQRKLTDKEIEDIWCELEDITVIEDSEGNQILNDNWFIFEKGTESNEIWGWFNNNHSKGLRYLIDNIC